MKILYSAFACDPYIGSEAQCGWSWPMAMRGFNEVYLITRSENREPIERYMNENRIGNITVFYHDIPSWMNMYYKKKRLYFLYYILWQRTALHIARRLQRQYHFDYIQHITLGDFRVIGPLWRLEPKFIFGPVGGAQTTPRVFNHYIWDETSKEKLREWINRIVMINPFYRRALNRSYRVFAANRETLSLLQKSMKHPEKCMLLTENGIQTKKILNQKKTDKASVTTILWAGRLITRKGIAFLLETIGQVKTSKPFMLKLVGDGPQMRKLKDLSSRLNLEDRVAFMGKVSYEQMNQIYMESDFFVFPSLRETTGTVLFEAMSHGLPVVSFNQNGADLLIDETCGRKIDIHQSLEGVKKDFAHAVEELIEKPETRLSLGENAYRKIKDHYTWEQKCQTFEQFMTDERV